MSNDIRIDEHDLPTWMRQARQVVDWGVVIVFCFSLIIASPFILQSDIPHNNDLENHAYMAHTYANALREGRLYPRWVEGALSGYGAPIGNYYPPATPYITAVMELFFTNDTIIALRLIAVGAIILCGVMTYLFMLRLTRAEYAIITALLYVYSPFIGQTIPYILGDLPLLIASALLPMSLWSIGRVITCQNPLDRVILAIICAMLWLTHLKMGILTSILLIIFLGGAIVIRPIKWGRIAVAILAILAGLGLSAFFWLPSWTEQDLVTWIHAPYTRLTTTMTFQTIFAPFMPIDLNQQVYIPQVGIGWGGIVTLILGIIGIFTARLYRRWWIFWGLCGAILTAIAIFLLPSELWLMTPISLCLAIVGSAIYAFTNRISAQIGRIILPTVIVGICLLALPVWLAPRWSDENTQLDNMAQITYEQLGYGVAVLPATAPIPITLPLPIVPNRGLISGYQDKTTSVVRIPQNQLTISKQAGLIFSQSHRDRYLIQTDTPAIFEVLRAYADGWNANVDGITVGLTPNSATGLIQVSVGRATNGVLTISYETTPNRQTAWGISGIVALFLVINALFALLRRKRANTLLELNLLSVESARLIGVIIIGFISFWGLFIMPQAPYSIYRPSGSGLIPFVAQNQKTDVGIELLGYQVVNQQDVYQVGDVIDVQVAWRTARRLTDNYQVVVFLEDINARGLRWLQSEPRYLAGYPSRRWSQEKYVLDEYRIPLTNVISAGVYRLVIEVYQCPNECLYENRITFFSSNGEFIGSQVALSRRFNVK
ncbi:MAG: hypothetical protein MUE54_09430 [Anaerolineae bacterium]|nr:hypothetical protein [Anaerolineae bacterium]